MDKVQEFISITPWTIIFQICNLLILCALVKKYLWKRVMAVLDKRQAEIDGLYDAAGKDRADAAQIKEEYTARMSSAREEADRLMKNAVDTAQRRGDAQGLFRADGRDLRHGGGHRRPHGGARDQRGRPPRAGGRVYQKRR